MQSQDFYLSEVEKSRAMTEMNERMKKVLTLSSIVNSKILFSSFFSLLVNVCLSESYVALWSLLKTPGSVLFLENLTSLI